MSLAPRLLALLPHPDDEIFIAYLLLRAAQGGADVTLVCATRGEAGQRRDGIRDPDLGATREAELRRSAAILGASRVEMLGWPDGAVADLPRPAALAALDAALRAHRPDVVVTLGPDGVYGHRDHVALTALLAEILPAPPPRWLQAAFPPGAMEPLRRALRRARPSPIDPRVGALGEAPPSAPGAALVLPAGALRGAKEAAIAAHATQLRRGEVGSFLHAAVLGGMLDGEAYRVAAGPPLPAGAEGPFDGLPGGEAP